MLNVNEISRLYLGIQGENLARPLVIDVKPWLLLYPEGSVSIWHKRNGYQVPEPTGAVFDNEAGTVTWSPTSTDTYVDGEGEAEIRLTVGTVIKKSRSIITGVSPAVTGAGVPLGSDWQSYINEVERIKSLAVTAKQDAEDAAEDAEAYAVGTRGGEDVESTDPAYHNNAKYYAEETAGAVENAEAYAIGTRNGEPVSSDDPTYENNSKYYAERAAEIIEETEEQIIEAAKEEVDQWLDDHPEATTTVDFTIATKVFPNVASMIADDTLKNGENVATRNYYADGDNGGSNYVISSTHTGVFYITLNNGLYANLLSEKGILHAESIGIKAYNASTENPDATDMTNNVTLFNLAIYNGIYLLFGKGYYYFNSAVQLAHKNTYTIRGVAREVTHLIFPSSDGFYFSDPIYYNYYVIRGMHIKAYGHTIRCAEDCLTVLDSHFEWLHLESETGDCFHAPNYNVAKYTNQGGSTIYDTCVQNCVFDFVNASAPMGAAFANIMGMYTYYMHLNIVSCKYAFRNCDGHVEQANTLGTQEDYYIYYDKANSHSIRWTFINVNAEGLSKAFIYCEPRQAAGAGEDPKKPETANIVSIERITAINSGWSLRGVESGHDVYPMTVQELKNVCLMNSFSLVSPSAYPSKYDTTIVKGHILGLTSAPITIYQGGPDLDVVNGNTVYKRFGDVNQRTGLTVNNNGGYTTLIVRTVPTFTELYVSRMYGGKALDVWETKASETTTSQPNPPFEHAFCDVIVFDVDTNSNKSLINFCASWESRNTGRFLTLCNSKTSLKDLTLNSVNGNRNYSNYALAKEWNNGITLKPGEQVTLITEYDYNAEGNNWRTVWKPIDGNYSNSWWYKNDWLYDLIYKLPSHDKLIPMSEGWINLNVTTADLTDIKACSMATGTYGYTYAIIPCSEGDEFTILHAATGGVTQLWGFTSNTGYINSKSSLGIDAKELTITAPAGTSYLVVNSVIKTAIFKSN